MEVRNSNYIPDVASVDWGYCQRVDQPLKRYIFAWMDIADLANNKQLLSFARIHAGEYADDIIQDALLAMLEMPKEKLQQVQDDNAVLFYAQQVVFNMSRGMYKKNRIADLNLIHGLELSHVPMDETEDDQLILHERAIEILYKLYPDNSKEYPYNRELFLLYCELGSCRKVQEATHINYCAVYRTVKIVKDELRERLMVDM